MIKKLSLIFGSITKAQEILYLIHGAKEVVRQGFYESELIGVERFCKEQGLYLEVSKFKVLLADEAQYSNKGIRISGDDKRPGMQFVYISKNEKSSLLAAYYELMQNNKDLGLELGYPECCVDFFLNNFSKQNTNPQHQPTNIFTNITKREQDCVILSHFPCSSNCEKSVKLAKSYLDVLMKVDKDRVEELIEELKCN